MATTERGWIPVKHLVATLKLMMYTHETFRGKQGDSEAGQKDGLIKQEKETSWTFSSGYEVSWDECCHAWEGTL